MRSLDPMPHPFKAGGVFENRSGKYEVIAIRGDHITVRYLKGGGTMDTDIATAQRIWEHIQLENEAKQQEEKEETQPTMQQKRKHDPKTVRSPTKLPPVFRFKGFTQDDFETLAGSTWRCREAIGQPYQSWAVDRRLELHLARVDKYRFRSSLPCAKLFVYSHDDLAYGFYIETPGAADRDHFPERFRDWDSFKRGLRTEAATQAVLLEPMSNHGLMLADYYNPKDRGALGCKFCFVDGSLHWWRPGAPHWTPVDVKVMFDRLSRLPEDQYVNPHLYTQMRRADAIANGAAVVNPILQVLRSLTPLYQMTVQ